MMKRWVMSRRTMLFPASLAVGALLLAGCSAGGGGGDKSDDGTVELHVAVWSNWDFVKRAGDAYTSEHPNVKITVDAISGDDYFPALPRTLTTSDAADITVLQVVGTGSYQDLVESGGLA